MVGGYRFFDRREVRDLIAYLRVLANPRDETALMRIINRPRRGVGEGSIAKISAFILDQPEDNRPDLISVLERMEGEPGLVPGLRADTVASIHEFLELLSNFRSRFARADRLSPVLNELIKELNFEAEFRSEYGEESVVKARMLTLSELVNMMSYFEDNYDEPDPPTLFDFLARISLMASDQDQDEEDARGRVQLLTLHLAKGLEFPVVFLTGMEEGLFPATAAWKKAKAKKRCPKNAG